MVRNKEPDRTQSGKTTIGSVVPATFETAFARVRQLVADLLANEEFYLFPTGCRDGLDRQIDALVCDLRGLDVADFKIVEETPPCLN